MKPEEEEELKRRQLAQLRTQQDPQRYRKNKRMMGTVYALVAALFGILLFLPGFFNDSMVLMLVGVLLIGVALYLYNWGKK